jgi:uncharacterized protein (DUF342 family)
MKSKKLLAALGDLLDRKKSKKLKHLDELKALLLKLEKKKVALQEEIPLEQNKHKLERLRKELEVVQVQQAKGLKTLQKLEKE